MSNLKQSNDFSMRINGSPLIESGYSTRNGKKIASIIVELAGYALTTYVDLDANFCSDSTFLKAMTEELWSQLSGKGRVPYKFDGYVLLVGSVIFKSDDRSLIHEIDGYILNLLREKSTMITKLPLPSAFMSRGESRQNKIKHFDELRNDIITKMGHAVSKGIFSFGVYDVDVEHICDIIDELNNAGYNTKIVGGNDLHISWELNENEDV